LKEDKYAKALAEVYIVLQNSEKEIQDKIPEKFKNFVVQNMEKEYVPTIDFNDANWDDSILEETQAILAIIYRDYIVSKEEREKLLEEETKEESRLERELREKYNPDNIFKNNINIEKNSSEETSLVVIEEKWYKKIFNFIKKYLGKLNKKEVK